MLFDRYPDSYIWNSTPSGSSSLLTFDKVFNSSLITVARHHFLTKISTLKQGQLSLSTGRNLTYLASTSFFRLFCTTLSRSTFPVNTCDFRQNREMSSTDIYSTSRCPSPNLHFSHNTPFLPLNILHIDFCASFLLGITMVPREIKDNAKFGGANKI